MIYNFIVNPNTGERTNIFSKAGKSILLNYLDQVGGSSAAGMDTALTAQETLAANDWAHKTKDSRDSGGTFYAPNCSWGWAEKPPRGGVNALASIDGCWGATKHEGETTSVEHQSVYTTNASGDVIPRHHGRGIAPKVDYLAKLAVANTEAKLNTLIPHDLSGPVALSCAKDADYDKGDDCMSTTDKDSWVTVHTLKSTEEDDYYRFALQYIDSHGLGSNEIVAFSGGVMEGSEKNPSPTLCHPVFNPKAPLGDPMRGNLYPGSDSYGSCTDNSGAINVNQKLFVTVEDDIIFHLKNKEFLSTYNVKPLHSSGRLTLAKLHKRIYKLLGLNTGWGGYGFVVSFDVQIKNLIRPCIIQRDPSGISTQCDPIFNQGDPLYQSDPLVEAQKTRNLGTGSLDNAPFTGLGYTYDIDAADTSQFLAVMPQSGGIRPNKFKWDKVVKPDDAEKHVGPDEYIVPWGSPVKNFKVQSFKDYITEIVSGSGLRAKMTSDMGPYWDTYTSP